MGAFPERVVTAQQAQLSRRRAALNSGARHVGWKVALGIPGADELVADAPLAGYLTSESLLAPAATFTAQSARLLQVDSELAVELGRDVGSATPEAVSAAIRAVASGLEVCDVGQPAADFESIVAGNVFHRAVAFGDFTPPSELPSRARVVVNGTVAAEAAVPDPVPHIVGLGQLLRAVGERLREGDRIICGAICSAYPSRGDEVEGQVEGLGPVGLRIA